MKHTIWIFIFFLYSVRAVVNAEFTDIHFILQKKRDSKCWRLFRAPELFQFMEKIDKEYATVREDVQRYLDKTNFTKRMLEKITDDGIDHRNSSEQSPHRAKIPAGINLGGLCAMSFPTSVLYLHSMKLCEDTFFEVKNLYNDIDKMIHKAQLSFNNLILTEAYDSSLINKDLSILKHTNSHGELQIGMKDVLYTIEGRYVMKKERLAIEVMVSTLDYKNITLTHTNANETDPPIYLEKQNMEVFMLRLKADLDKWMQNHFNDCLMNTSLEDVPSISKLREYDQHKGSQLDEFVDNMLIWMNDKLQHIAEETVVIPDFKIRASHNMSIWIHAGTVQGLDTMYRRSEATRNFNNKNILDVDTIIGFRDLKVIYAYEIQSPQGPQTSPALKGLLIMSAHQQIARMTLELVNETKILDLDIDFLNRMGPDTITIEGAAKTVMTNFKHILQYEIATIMSNSVLHSIEVLKTLPNCGKYFERPKLL